MVSDTRFVLKRRWSEDWSPRNYDGRYMGNVTVQTALEQSLNAASVRIGLASGIDAILKTARTLGITEKLDTNPSILLGAAGIPPIQMAEAYATIARQGARVPPRAIRFVTDDRGRTMRGAGKAEPVQVFPQRDVYLLTSVMKGVVDRGTAASARGMGFRKVAAGKTGTTNDKRDAWFIGFTPKTLALTWVGFDDNDPTGLSGSDAAVPMWARYMIAVTAGEPNADFAAPTGVTMAEFDKSTGGMVTPYCPRDLIARAAFKSGTEPSQPCQPHSATQTLPPAVAPVYDQFGNLIITDTATATDTAGAPPTPPDATLTGGVFQPQQPPPVAPPPIAPPPVPRPAPPTTTTEEPPEDIPPPMTDTSTTTGGPP